MIFGGGNGSRVILVGSSDGNVILVMDLVMSDEIYRGGCNFLW